MNLRDYQLLKDKAERLKDQASRAQGSIDAEMKALMALDSKITNLENGENLLKTLQDQLKTEEGQYDSAFEAFKKRWKDDLGRN